MKKRYKIVICMAACLFLAACLDEGNFGIVETDEDGSFAAVMANGETAGTDGTISAERSKEDAGNNVTEASGEHEDENITEASGEHADENITEASGEYADENATETSAQETTDSATKKSSESVTEKSSERVTEKPSKKVAESETIKPTQKATQAPTQAATQSVTQAPTEAETVSVAQVPTQATVMVPTEMPSTEPTPTQGAEQMTPDQTEAVTQAEMQTPTEGVTEAATEPAPMNDMQMRVSNNVWVYSEFAQKVIGLTNIKRKESGLPMLQYDANLCKLATHRCFENIDNNIFSHTRPDGTSCFTIYAEYGLLYAAAAENLAAGQTTPEQVVEAWLNSPLHKENIYGNYDYIGVGIAVDDAGCYYWAQCFATYQ